MNRNQNIVSVLIFNLILAICKMRNNQKRPLDKDYINTSKETKKLKEENPEIWGKLTIVDKDEASDQNVVKEKANFGLTGALAKDTNTGNTVHGKSI